MKKCFFCGEENYSLLDAHRIMPRGVYHFKTVLCCCANCHRKCHSKNIIVEDRKYTTTLGENIIHYWENGQEFWKKEIIFS
jgi:hypothetical protein